MLRSPKTLELPEGVERHLPTWRDVLKEAYARLRGDIQANSITRVAVASDYVASRFDTIIAVTDSSVARAITLAPVAKVGPARIVLVKDEGGQAGGALTHINIIAAGADTIEGAANREIAVNNGWLRIYSDGIATWWLIGMELV